MTNLTWRRCPACGQLTLVPASAETCWQCGAPIAGRPTENAAGHAARASSPFRPAEISPPPASTPADLNLPPPRPKFMDLTAEDDVIARRLLATVFPDGVDF